MIVIKVGNGQVIVHGEVAKMTDEEHAEWAKGQRENNNPIFLEIDRILSDYYKKHHNRNDCEE